MSRFRSALWLCVSLALGSCGPPNGMPDAYMEPLPGTYANVTTIFAHSCQFSSCHGGAGAGAAHLNFQRSIAAGTLITDLVDAPACQYGPMPLVTAGDPGNSWLYYKIAGPHTGSAIDFTPDPGWDHDGLMPNTSGVYPASTCPFTVHGQISFGAVMPMGAGATLRPDQAETIRLWIEAGAPGP
jgi:hypothetical protein